MSQASLCAVDGCCRPWWRRAMPMAVVAGLALLSACASVPEHTDQSQEAARYLAHARNYNPPGPPEDPWGPYIREASDRFDVPDRWIRQVMRQESGGHQYQNGEPTTSPVGAMGLMQVMPETYDGLRERYGLGDDPYNPADNILAGTAYIREMYELYGNPGFLAAYNAGPRRLDDYLAHGRRLPDETRHYVASIGPYIADAYPVHRSAVDLDGSVSVPINIPAGPRGSARTRYAGSGHAPVQVAMLPEPPAPAPPPAAHVQLASAHAKPGFHLIPQALAAESLHHGGRDWAIQVGAFGNQHLAVAAAGSAHGAAGGKPVVASVHQGHGTLYRARVVGLSRDAAVQACEKLKSHGGCTVLSPDSQS